MLYVTCQTRLRTAFGTAHLTSSLRNMIDVAKSDVWSDWTTLGARFARCAIFGIVRRFPCSAELPISLSLSRNDRLIPIPCREPCSLDQPNHSLQAYAVSIEEMNVVDNSACKIRTVATVAANADQYSGRCRSILELRSP